MKIDEMSPRQWVRAQQIDFLHGMYRTVERHHAFNGTDLTPAKAREVMTAIARQHNTLLADSGLDGTELPVSAEPVPA